MEQNSLNRAELRGRIGQEPRISNVGEAKYARFSIATNETFKDKKGELKEETTWHNIVAWSGKTISDFSILKKGVMVSRSGKIRNIKYKNQNNSFHLHPHSCT